MKIGCICGLLLLALGVSAQEKPVYKQPEAPVEVRVDDLLKRMTLDEKIAQLRHLHYTQAFDGQVWNEEKLSRECRQMSWGFLEGFRLTGEGCRQNYPKVQQFFKTKTRLGIPVLMVGEALHGAVHEGATVFPQNVALGSTFNERLAREKARLISEELHYLGIRQILAPCIDVIRELRWGRVEESFGEDPYLCGVMGVNEVKGYLENGISPMLKHFGPHGNPRGGLNLASVDCGVGDLLDIYLKPFEMVVRNTDLAAVMSSYNSWNRIPNSACAFMLKDVLRERWGFRGLVYSDWGAIRMLKDFHGTAADDKEAAYQAFSSGLDVEASSTCYPYLADLVKEGRLTEADLDESVRRVLSLKFKLGLFDEDTADRGRWKASFHSPEAVELAKQIADESVVLLQNRNGILPFAADRMKSLAVIGPNADRVQLGDYTWAGEDKDGVTPLEGFRELVGNRLQLRYARGCEIASTDTTGIGEAVQVAAACEAAVVLVGNSSCKFVRESAQAPTSGEGYDLSDISLTPAQQQLVEAVTKVNANTVVVLVTGKPMAIPWIKAHVPGIVVQWYGGECAGHSIAQVLFGEVNPSGKLPLSFPQSTGHLPCFYNYLPTDKGFYGKPGSWQKPGMDYVFASPQALWNFGYGLSYTDFECAEVELTPGELQEADSVVVSLRIKNTGRLSGKEVVQVYARDCCSSMVTPVQKLVAFRKVALEPDEEKRVRLTFPVSRLAFTDNSGKVCLEKGDFEIRIGTASDRIIKTFRVSL